LCYVVTQWLMSFLLFSIAKEIEHSQSSIIHPFIHPSISKDARVTPTSHPSAESEKQHRPHSAPPRLDLDL
ncbi:hypothetical protein C360_05790, partial [Cryptococcus neoformans Bt15]